MHDWKALEDAIGRPAVYRLRVPGGWLYRLPGGDPLTFVPLPRGGHFSHPYWENAEVGESLPRDA